MTERERRLDVIVVGLGAMGSAALYQLSKRGVSVLGIDRFRPPHDRGSSHGETRITRQAVGEGPAYVPFALRSHEVWDELERLTGERVLHRVGCLIMSIAGGSHDLHGVANFVEQTARNAEAFGIEHRMLDNEQLRSAYPRFDVRHGERGVLEPNGGYVNPERSIALQLQLAAENGAAIRVGEDVHAIDGSGDPTVRTDTGVFSAKKVIVTAGPWVDRFLPQGAPPLRAMRQVLYWFDIDSGYDELRDLPTFIWIYGEGGDDYMYGFPARDGPGGGMKLATEQFSLVSDADRVDRHVRPEEATAFFERHVDGRIRGLSRRSVRSVACLYTVSDDRDFVIDTHPHSKNVIVASPCSGHGFKHSAAIGEALCQLALDGRSELDIGAFSLSRFSGAN